MLVYTIICIYMLRKKGIEKKRVRERESERINKVEKRKNSKNVPNKMTTTSIVNNNSNEKDRKKKKIHALIFNRNKSKSKADTHTHTR